MTMKCALAVSILIATVGIAQAQREGGAFFGPFAHGSSMGAAPVGPGYCGIAACKPQSKPLAVRPSKIKRTRK
jgi:hypothetical protein